MNGNVGPMSHH